MAAFGDFGAMARVRKERPPTASEQLEKLLGYPWPFPGRSPKRNLSAWIVTDDWSEHVPVTEAEVDVFEAWFGDLFDELFGPRKDARAPGRCRRPSSPANQELGHRDHIGPIAGAVVCAAEGELPAHG